MAEYIERGILLDRIRGLGYADLIKDNLLLLAAALPSDEHCAELIKAEQEGRLIVLPCKVGTVVWSSELTEIDDDGVEHVAPWSFVPGMMDEWGKSFFLTRAEAEKAMEVSGDA